MIENTLENKAKFFALYLNQRKCIIRQGYINRDNINPNGVDKYDSLELKSLSSITDEDAETVGELFHKVDMQLSPDNLATWSIKEVKEQIEDLALVAPIADFFRSKGYLLTWMGLTPDEIIERGWAKIKED